MTKPAANKGRHNALLKMRHHLAAAPHPAQAATALRRRPRIPSIFPTMSINKPVPEDTTGPTANSGFCHILAEAGPP